MGGPIMILSYCLYLFAVHCIALMHINLHRHFLFAWIYKFVCILKRFHNKADGIDYSVFMPPKQDISVLKFID